MNECENITCMLINTETFQKEYIDHIEDNIALLKDPIAEDEFIDTVQSIIDTAQRLQYSFEELHMQ